MAKCIPTWHSKVRYSERVDYRESMVKTLKKVMKYGVRIDDVPVKYRKERSFLQRNKIYYNGKVYIFAGQNKYHHLLTVYPHRSHVLEDIYQLQERERKSKYYKQMFTQQRKVLYRVSFYKDKIYEVKPVLNREYTLDLLEDKKLKNTISKHMMKLIKGFPSEFKVTLYLEELDEFEKMVYKRVMEIKRGQTITYKNLAEEFGVTTQKITGILKRCPMPILIPTHRVVKNNGQIGSHSVSKELKKHLLEQEKKELKTIVKNKKQFIKIQGEEENKDEYFSYNISSLLKDLF